MGPVNSPPVPVVWRERRQDPIAPRQMGLEVRGRTNSQGQPAIYCVKDCNECYKLAEADGWKF